MASAAAANVNEVLMDAVSAFDFPKVASLLAGKADPNYRRLTSKEGADTTYDPDTPLRLVIFRISDCGLSVKDLVAFSNIAKLLLDEGASPIPALDLAELRYGTYEDYKDGGGQHEDFRKAFCDVHKLVAVAAETAKGSAPKS